MADLTTHNASACASTREWTGTIRSVTQAIYTVTWGRNYSLSRTADFGYTCDCLGFKFRKTCRHIGEIEARDGEDARCTWDSRWDAPEAADGTCPCCNGPTFSFSFGA